MHRAIHVILTKSVLTITPAAKLIEISTEAAIDADTREALKAYLTNYLEFLRRAGNHVYFDLPDFDDDKYTAVIDYSRGCDQDTLDKFCGHIAVQTIDVTQINEQLAKNWAAAQRLLLTNTEDKLRLSLAAFSSQWLTNFSINGHFYIQFRAPRVAPLCSQEVIFYLDIARVWFFDSEDFTV